MLELVRHARAYAFVVVAIAATLVVGAVLRRPVQVATATAEVSQTVVPLIGDSLRPEMALPIHDSAAVIAEISSADNIAAAIASSAFLRSAANDSNIDTQTFAADIARAVTVADDTGPADNQRTLTIQFSGPTPNTANASEFATQVVEALAQRYVDRHQGRGDDGRLARWQAAVDQKRQAQTELDAARIALRDAKAQAITPPTPTKQPHRMAAGRNPRWLELHQRLENMRQRRIELLNDVTENHPELKDYDAHAAELSKQLKATPQWIELGRTSEQGEGKDNLREISDALAQHQRITQATRAATTRLGTARETFNALAEAERETQRAASTTARLDLAWYSPQDAHEKIGKHTPRGGTSLALLVALAGGGFAAVCVGKPDLTFRSVRQARRMLGVPVLAVLPSSGGDSHKSDAPSGWRLARYARIMAEIVVLGFIAAWVVCVSADSSFAADVVVQPLATLSGSIERACSIVAR